ESRAAKRDGAGRRRDRCSGVGEAGVMSMNAYVAPISHAQRRLWFLDRLEPGNPVYNIPVAVRLRGRLDRVALERALQAIVARHDALRTTFAMENGEPVQVVHETLALAVALETVTDETTLAARLRDEARGAFDL